METNEQIAYELHALNEGINQLNRTLQIAAEGLYSGNILAAKIMAAKKDYDFNTAVKDALQIQDTMNQKF